MALTKERAVSMITYAVEQRMKKELKYADFIQDEIQGSLQYNLNEDNLSTLQIIEYSNGFYLGHTQNKKLNGFGIYLWYGESGHHSFYIGYWKDGEKHGEDGIYCMNNAKTYFGGFVHGKFDGEDGYFVDNSGLLIHAVFQQGEIVKVKQNNYSFTFNGKKFDENGKREEDGSSCLGCLGIIFIIPILFWTYSYLSPWLDTLKTGDSQKTELYKSTTTYICKARKSLKVRSQPNLSSRQIGSLKAGEEVDVYEIIDDFAKIRIGGERGYASIKYLEKK